MIVVFIQIIIGLPHYSRHILNHLFRDLWVSTIAMDTGTENNFEEIYEISFVGVGY